MLARIKANQIGRTGLRMAAVLAGSQLTVAAAIVGDHVKAAGACAGGSAFELAVTVGQTAWSMLNACLIGQIVQAAGMLLASDSSFNVVHAVVGVIGHVAQIVPFVFQILS